MTLVIVPYRSDGGHRDRLWAHLLEHYWGPLPYTVVLGHHTVGPFNRSAAINAAADRAWDVAIIADSDTWVPVRQLREAVRLATSSGRLVSALTHVAELDAGCTERILSGKVNFLDIGLDKVRSGDLATQSSMLAVPRRLWDRIGGFDEAFAGWGGEDNAFWRAATILGQPPHRVEGYAYHLWHKPAIDTEDRRRDPAYQRNLARWNRYRTAKNERTLRQVQASA
jgi:GT2 family glycosyltransferase